MKKKTKQSADHAYPVGQAVLVETVTKFYLGRLVEVAPQELVLEDAAWIADTGRFNEFLLKGDGGSTSEFEPCPDGQVVIGRGAVVACLRWAHPLIRLVK